MKNTQNTKNRLSKKTSRRSDNNRTIPLHHFVIMLMVFTFSFSLYSYLQYHFNPVPKSISNMRCDTGLLFNTLVPHRHFEGSFSMLTQDGDVLSYDRSVHDYTFSSYKGRKATVCSKPTKSWLGGYTDYMRPYQIQIISPPRLFLKFDYNRSLESAKSNIKIASYFNIILLFFIILLLFKNLKSNK